MKAVNVVKGLASSFSMVCRESLGLPLRPRWLWLELTDKCNSRCITCSIWKQKATPKKDCLSPDELFRLLSNPLLSKVRYILNSGGECTLVDLKAYLKAEHDALPKATLQISSNGLKPSALVDAVMFAVDIGVSRVDVGLSIDGIGEAHDAIRGVKGNFSRLMLTVDELQMLQKVYPQIRISWGSTLTDLTANYAKALYKFSEDLGIPFSWHWYNESNFYSNKGNCSDSKIKEVIDALPSRYLYWSFWQKYLRTGDMPKFKCFALKTFFALHCNGDVSPCLSRWNHVVGNVRRQPIDQIWNSYKMAIERDDIVDCVGCLNSWSFQWSINSLYYPRIFHRVKHLLS